MTRRAPPPAGRSLGRVGRALLFEVAGGRQLFRLPAGDERVSARLLELGGAGLGGFTEGGVDDDGVWLERDLGQSLAKWLSRHEGPIEWRRAAAIARDVARALSAAEDENLFPGPLSPKTIGLRGDGPSAIVHAEPLLRAMVGGAVAEDGASPGASGSTRWMPPEQAAGRPWDNAANRYVLGLVLYRLLAGTHPFSGAGLRRALDDQAARGAPPLPADVARELPRGLQSYCLRLLEPSESDRPRSGAEVAERLDDFAEGRQGAPRTARVAGAESDEADEQLEESSDPKAAPGTAPDGVAVATRRRGWAWRFVAPIAAGGAVAYAATGVTREAPRAVQAAPRVPLTSATTSVEDCASCHPRQSGEWHRSVMAHSVKSPLFQALEILIQEQGGRDRNCAGGAGILRTADPATACRDELTGRPVTGSGGELWCVNCHAPGENLRAVLPPWDGRSRVSASRLPLRDLLPASTMEGISCAVCHQTHGPVRPGAGRIGQYEGNPFWTSTRDGTRFPARPEDVQGLFGIANSGYSLAPNVLLLVPGAAQTAVPGGAHAFAPEETRDYLRSSEFCGACHDVRLFGTDVIGAGRGEHFKRLRNGFTEWRAWARDEERAGRRAASCQDCHMSEFPGTCVPAVGVEPNAAGITALDRACPPGTRFSAKPPGSYPSARRAVGSADVATVTTHYFSGVDVPLAREFAESLANDLTLDGHGIPLGAEQRRDLLLGATFRLDLDASRRVGSRLEIPVVVENVGAGHRVPAGFSQEREFWIHLRVTDATGRTVYEVGRVDRDDENLRDKVFLRVNTADTLPDGAGRPLGLFGADVADGPDVPRWNPPPDLGGTNFRGRGLVNFQNGFLRCVVCIGDIDGSGQCRPAPGQDRVRAARYADGDYDQDTGECRSNLRGHAALFETYFPVGALDATRGVLKAPDAIIDTRSLPPKTPVRYTYDLASLGGRAPFRVDARLLFRAFPPFLITAFADYEARQAAQGRRPSGPLVTRDALERLRVVELAVVQATIE